MGDQYILQNVDIHKLQLRSHMWISGDRIHLRDMKKSVSQSKGQNETKLKMVQSCK